MVDEYGNLVARTISDEIAEPKWRGGAPFVEDYGFFLLRHPESGYFWRIEQKYGVDSGRKFVDLCLSHRYTDAQIERYYRIIMEQGKIEAQKYIQTCKMQCSEQSLKR